MRAATLLAVLAALLLAGCGGGGDPEVVQGEGYEVSVPDDWEDASERADEVEFGGFTPDVILVADREDGFQTNVNVIREPSLSSDVDLREYVDAARKLLEGGGIPGGEQLPSTPTGFSEPEPTELDGEDALSHEYGLSAGGRDLKFRQVMTVRERTGYSVTYTALESAFDERLDDFESVVDSWEWR